MLGMVGRGYGVAGMLRMIDEGWIRSTKGGYGRRRVDTVKEGWKWWAKSCDGSTNG